MVEENLIVNTPKTRKYNSYKGEISPEVENIINRDFHANKPNEKWLTDVSEFKYGTGDDEKKGKIYFLSKSFKHKTIVIPTIDNIKRLLKYVLINVVINSLKYLFP